jgi:hypothetical protein
MFTPNINATGIYSVKVPFTVVEGSVYKCVEISKITSLVSSGVDVYTVYYEPYGLAQEDYTADKDLDVNIVKLVSLSGEPELTLPSSYIEGIPSSAMVPYNRMLVSIDLGMLPDSLSLASLVTELTNLSTDITGATPTVKLHRVPVLGGIDLKQHELLELNRALLIQNRTSAHAAAARLSALLEKKDAYIATLEEALLTVQN